MATKDTGVVNIHGKEYKTVAKRVDEFRQDNGKDLSIITSLVDRDENAVVMKAEILDKDGRVIATGYAEEHRTASQINKTSALENCETSAIGRALANFGLGGGEYASADEVANAINQQEKVVINVPKYQKSSLSFDDIRAHLKTLNTSAEVNAYANEVSKAYPNPTDKQRYAIQTMFAERREDILNKSRAEQ
jgi:deoxycytidylate deaminase